MDLFKFIPSSGNDPTILESGEAINGYTSAMWVERYRNPGEFEIKAPLSSGLIYTLRPGALISHPNTYEVMVVENQEIIDDEESDSGISITGRSFPSLLEQRIVGTNQVRASSTISEYSLSADYTWNQAVKLINDHILNTTNPGDALVNVSASTTVTGTGASTLKTIKRADLLTSVMELLEMDDLGLKTVRRNTFLSGGNVQTSLIIYKGEDKTKSVIFSWVQGDITSANYLQSIKNYKTSMMVVSKYLNIIIDGDQTNYNRRMGVIDASDIDGQLNSPPTGSTLTNVVAKMVARAYTALANQKIVGITDSDFTPISRYEYRKDYNLGDLITIDGNFGTSAVMRVTEHVEIEDENGTSSHPALAYPGAP